MKGKKFAVKITTGCLIMLGFFSCSAPQEVDDNISMQIKTDKESFYSAQSFIISSNYNTSSDRKLSYRWFINGKQLTGVPETVSALQTSMYEKSARKLIFTVEVSNGIKDSTATKEITIVPYTESDVASVTFQNQLERNIYVLYLYSYETACSTGGEFNALNVPYLANGDSVTFDNLMPGSYRVVGKDIEGKNIYISFFTNLIRGSNVYILK